MFAREPAVDHATVAGAVADELEQAPATRADTLGDLWAWLVQPFEGSPTIPVSSGPCSKSPICLDRDKKNSYSLDQR